MKTPRYWRLGIPPCTPILPGLIYNDKQEAVARAREENRCGPYKGRGVKVYPCDQNGNIIWRDQRP